MIKCPESDWSCPYYDNGDCTLENCEVECDAFYTGDEEEENKKDLTAKQAGQVGGNMVKKMIEEYMALKEEEEEEEIEDKYTLDDLGNNWY